MGVRLTFYDTYCQYVEQYFYDDHVVGDTYNCNNSKYFWQADDLNPIQSVNVDQLYFQRVNSWHFGTTLQKYKLCFGTLNHDVGQAFQQEEVPIYVL